MISIISSTHGTSRAGARTWTPRPSRPSAVEPTVPELLEMADGTRADWRSEPTARDLRAAEREIPALLAEFGALLYTKQLPQLEKERDEARANHDHDRAVAVERRIDDLWDAVGHLAVGT